VVFLLTDEPITHRYGDGSEAYRRAVTCQGSSNHSQRPPVSRVANDTPDIDESLFVAIRHVLRERTTHGSLAYDDHLRQASVHDRVYEAPHKRTALSS
jgi:hypothetical protein